MAKNDTFNKIDELAKTLKATLIKKDMYASGNLDKSIIVDEKIDEKSRKYEIISNFYIEFLENGREPGGMPPIDAIQSWIDDKNLDLNAWAVAKTIEKKGTTWFRNKNGKIITETFTNEATQEIIDVAKKEYLEETRILLASFVKK